MTAAEALAAFKKSPSIPNNNPVTADVIETVRVLREVAIQYFEELAASEQS